MNEKILTEGNRIHNFTSSSGSGTVINSGSGSEFVTSYGSGPGSVCKKVTVPVPVTLLLRTSTLQTEYYLNVIYIRSGWSWRRDAGWPVMLIFRIRWENSTLPSPPFTMLKTSSLSGVPRWDHQVLYVKGTLLEIINIFFTGDLGFSFSCWIIFWTTFDSCRQD